MERQREHQVCVVGEGLLQLLDLHAAAIHVGRVGENKWGRRRGGYTTDRGGGYDQSLQGIPN